MSTHALPHNPAPIHIDKPGKAGSLLALTETDIEQIVGITQNYFPPSKVFAHNVRQHLDTADSIRVARTEDAIVGIACASLYRHKTPFYRKPIPVIYQRMLYLHPDYIRRSLGMLLQMGILAELLGPLWPLRRFEIFCHTLNPVIAHKFRFYSESYPKPDTKIPETVLEYARSLASLFGANELDSHLRLVDVLAEYREKDFSTVWHNYLKGINDSYNGLLLDAGFRQDGEKIFSRGDSIMMIAYAKPMALLHFLLRHLWRHHSLTRISLLSPS